MLQENRKHERVQPRLRCWCEGRDVTVYAQIRDLSEGGLHLRLSAPLERGCATSVRFRFEDAEEVSAIAKVVWTRGGGDGIPPGMGLKFEQVPPAAMSRIRQIVHGAPRTAESLG